MKKIITTAILLVLSAGGIDANMQRNTETDSTTVYICTGKSSKRYHKTDDCRGLNNCSGSIKAVSIEQAKKSGRTPCRVCW